MAIVEVHPRTFSTRFGESPSAERNFIDTPDVASDQVLLPVIGEAHPEQFNLKAQSIEKTTGANNDPNTTTYSVRYEPAPTCELDPNPLNRCDRWSLTVGSMEKPFTSFTNDSNEVEPVVNAALEPINGLKVRSIDPKLSVSAYRSDFPLSTVQSVVNKTNTQTWAGGAAGTWLCSGSNASQHTELVSGIPVDFWAVSFDFSYRAEGWVIKTPNVGFRFKKTGSSGQDYYRTVIRSPGGLNVASPTTLPLNADGTLNNAAKFDKSQMVYLEFKPYYGIDFNSHFGEPE
ncbi:MAG: hypothetical protein ISR34_09410 [Pirellulales bacterium]|nr:hypothetical protein [Pirellulales bacterium]